jgi:hypothetical protein
MPVQGRLPYRKRRGYGRMPASKKSKTSYSRAPRKAAITEDSMYYSKNVGQRAGGLEKRQITIECLRKSISWPTGANAVKSATYRVDIDGAHAGGVSNRYREIRLAKAVLVCTFHAVGTNASAETLQVTIAKAVDDTTPQANYNPLTQLGAVTKFVGIGPVTGSLPHEVNTMRFSMNYPLLDVGGAIVGSRTTNWVQGSLAGLLTVNWSGAQVRVTSPEDAGKGMFAMDYYWSLTFDCKGRV